MFELTPEEKERQDDAIAAQKCLPESHKYDIGTRYSVRYIDSPRIPVIPFTHENAGLPTIYPYLNSGLLIYENTRSGWVLIQAKCYRELQGEN